MSQRRTPSALKIMTKKIFYH